MVQEYIEIRGARENNLKEVELRLPKRKLIIFTGVSGSGKSSIVFDTIANEAQRLLFENFSMFVRTFLPRYPQPDADTIENLSMAVIVDQKRLGGRAQSTVGTEQDWATKLGVRTPEGALLTDEGLSAHRDAYRTAIRALHAQGKPARTWPLRYLIRHTAFHTLDHAWEMEDKDLTGNRV